MSIDNLDPLFDDILKNWEKKASLKSVMEKMEEKDLADKAELIALGIYKGE